MFFPYSDIPESFREEKTCRFSFVPEQKFQGLNNQAVEDFLNKRRYSYLQELGGILLDWKDFKIKKVAKIQEDPLHGVQLDFKGFFCVLKISLKQILEAEVLQTGSSRIVCKCLNFFFALIENKKNLQVVVGDKIQFQFRFISYQQGLVCLHGKKPWSASNHPEDDNANSLDDKPAQVDKVDHEQDDLQDVPKSLKSVQKAEKSAKKDGQRIMEQYLERKERTEDDTSETTLTSSEKSAIVRKRFSQSKLTDNPDFVKKARRSLGFDDAICEEERQHSKNCKQENKTKNNNNNKKPVKDTNTKTGGGGGLQCHVEIKLFESKYKPKKNSKMLEDLPPSWSVKVHRSVKTDYTWHTYISPDGQEFRGYTKALEHSKSGSSTVEDSKSEDSTALESNRDSSMPLSQHFQEKFKTILKDDLASKERDTDVEDMELTLTRIINSLSPSKEKDISSQASQNVKAIKKPTKVLTKKRRLKKVEVNMPGCKKLMYQSQRIEKTENSNGKMSEQIKRKMIDSGTKKKAKKLEVSSAAETQNREEPSTSFCSQNVTVSTSSTENTLLDSDNLNTDKLAANNDADKKEVNKTIDDQETTADNRQEELQQQQEGEENEVAANLTLLEDEVQEGRKIRVPSRLSRSSRNRLRNDDSEVFTLTPGKLNQSSTIWDQQNEDSDSSESDFIPPTQTPVPTANRFTKLRSRSFGDRSDRKIQMSHKMNKTVM